MTQRKTDWTGATGTKYEYRVWPISTRFKAGQPGNYIFTKATPGADGSNTHTPLYIGETGDLGERFDNHHKIGCVGSHGATHLLVRGNTGGVEARREEERDLLNVYGTPCNG